MTRAMKDSGIEWIGNIPESWNVSRLGGQYEHRNEKVSDKDYQPLSVTKRGVLLQLETVAKSDAHDDRKLVKKGDFVINSRSDRRGSCGISNYDGSVSLINTVIKPRTEMNPIYYNWLFHTMQFADEFYKWGHGIVDDLWTTRWQDMKKITIPFPPIDEQNKIAAYLDKKCGEIDAIIEKVQEQITTLEEYKKSVISEAVTKGLNPNVSMKDSGIDWIGKIPANWEITKVKYISNTINKGNGITKEDVVTDGNIQCIRYGEIYSKYNNSFVCTHSMTNLNKISSPKYIKKGDILFAGTGELIEEIGKNIVYLGDKVCLAGGDIIILRHQQNCRYLNYTLNSHYAQLQKSIGKAKLKVVHISSSDIGNIFVALPSLIEQQEIVDYLDSQCSQVENAITDKQKQIETLEEYKKTLIYEYVTGKKEVA